MKPLFSNTREIQTFRRALLRWYDRHRRDLPWRKTRDAYRVWVSEIMLQQTRVAAVLEHFRSFLKRFPNVQRLAVARESSVLAAWSGLGYYRRARMMRLCARTVVKDHGGQFPRTADELRLLPGIGRYTAAAIASIAFEQPVAVVDGNVERVLSRLNGTSLSPTQLWPLAQSLVNGTRPGDHNQAMMELGATICTPRQPRCSMCPVGRWCATKAQIGTLRDKRESKSNLRQREKEVWHTLDQRNGHVRLVQRPANSSLMADMWELPSLQTASDSTAPWRTFRHSITVTNYTVRVVRQPAPRKGQWVSIARIPHMPITGLTRKILKAASII